MRIFYVTLKRLLTGGIFSSAFLYSVGAPMNVSAAFYNTWSIMLTELTPKIYRIKCLLFISNTLLLESTTTELCTMVCLYVLRICYGKL